MVAGDFTRNSRRFFRWAVLTQYRWENSRGVIAR